MTYIMMKPVGGVIFGRSRRLAGDKLRTC